MSRLPLRVLLVCLSLGLSLGLYGGAHAQPDEPAASSASAASPAGASPPPSAALLPAPPASPASPFAPPVLFPGPAHESPLTLFPAVDFPLTIGAVAAGLVPEVLKGELAGPHCGLMCDPADVNALDRSVIGNRSVAAAKASDALLYSLIAAPFVLDLIDALATGARSGQRGSMRAAARGWATDLVVLGEVLAVNFLVTNVVKQAVMRPRPLVYDPAVDGSTRLGADAALSFFSGHSSTTFAMATAYSILFMKRHPDHPGWYVPMFVVTEGLAAATAVLRTQAGKHFYTDVLAGAVVGASIGALIPLVHLRRPGSARAPAPGSAAALSLRVLPSVSTTGFGLTLLAQ